MNRSRARVLVPTPSSRDPLEGLRAPPRDRRLESTLALRRDPYGYIARTCRALGEDLFEARIMLRPTLCMSGPEAARLFYDREHFQREGAAPLRLQATLFGRGGVQTLDDHAHQVRKALFLKTATPPAVRLLADLAEQGWRRAARAWTPSQQVELYAHVREVLCRSVCAWAGVPLREDEVALRTAQLTALFDTAGSFGPKHWMGRLARRRAQRWAGGLIRAIRAGTLPVPADSAAALVALHRDADGQPLDERTAAVELLNLLRPTVAVAVYVVFVAVALHEHPECVRKLREDTDGRYAQWFAQEVRRFYPFFPAVAARLRHDFEWKGLRLRAGRRVLLDLYGTNHDERAWVAPGEFLPERFAAWAFDAYSFIPQGGGEAEHGHRCPGEGITMALMTRFARFLARELAYELPPQDLRLDTLRLPALPHSRFVIANVRLRPVAA
jgi:fatty-acid peroxygenase